MIYSKEQISDIIASHEVRDNVVVVGVRGGRDDIGQNQIGIYDDLIYIRTPNVFKVYTGNTDPTRWQIPGKMSGMASLICGVWRYKNGIHHPGTPRAYPCFIQAEDVTVIRYGSIALDTGDFGIHIHRGDYNSTSSEGCQTIHPDSWHEFYYFVTDELLKFNQKTFPYILMNNAIPVSRMI